MNRLGYWLVVLLLTALTLGLFRFTVTEGWTTAGTYGLFLTLVAFAVLLSFSLSMKNRDRRSRPIAR